MSNEYLPGAVAFGLHQARGVASVELTVGDARTAAPFKMPAETLKSGSKPPISGHLGPPILASAAASRSSVQTIADISGRTSGQLRIFGPRVSDMVSPQIRCASSTEASAPPISRMSGVARHIGVGVQRFRSPRAFAERTRRSMRYIVLALVVPVLATLAGCSEGVLNPNGPIASAERQILFNSLGIMLAIVIPTILATLAVAYWFRSSNRRARYLPGFEYSGRLELLVWSIPIMTVLLLAGVNWVGSYDLDPPKPIASKVKPVRVQVVSLDWKWLFIFPDQGIASVNQLTIPVGTPVSFELTSSGVMNSFWVPQLGGQIYTMAGMATRLNLQADNPGTYRGRSANYSGRGFADMYFDTDAVPAEKFAQWVDATRNAGPALDAQAYADLVKPSTAVAPFTYRSVAPNLFSRILSAGRPDDASRLTTPASQRTAK